MGQAFVLQDPTQPVFPRCDCKVAKLPWSITPLPHLSDGPKGRIQEGKEREEDLGPVATQEEHCSLGCATQLGPSILSVRPVRVQPGLSNPAAHKLGATRTQVSGFQRWRALACPRVPFKQLSPKNLSSQLLLPGLRSGSRAHPPSQLLPSSFLSFPLTPP